MSLIVSSWFPLKAILLHRVGKSVSQLSTLAQELSQCTYNRESALSGLIGSAICISLCRSSLLEDAAFVFVKVAVVGMQRRDVLIPMIAGIDCGREMQV